MEEGHAVPDPNVRRDAGAYAEAQAHRLSSLQR
jgi:hypothetical protein